MDFVDLLLKIILFELSKYVWNAFRGVHNNKYVYLIKWILNNYFIIIYELSVVLSPLLYTFRFG